MPDPLFQTIGIACDHAACDLKEHLLASELLAGYTWLDFGTDKDGGSVDYPDYAKAVVKGCLDQRVDCGLCLCGTGIGMSMVANRHPKIRAAVVWDKATASLSRKHNNANILCLGARLIEPKHAAELVKLWLTTPFQGGRHQKRLDKFSEFS